MKRSSTLASAVPDEVAAQVAAIAAARGCTVSDLIYQVLVEMIERERLTYLRLRQAFEHPQDLSD
jgi:hypothetical protein